MAPSQLLPRATAIRFHGRVGTGKTRPCRAFCEVDDEESETLLVLKLSAGCDLGCRALAAEALAAFLASDVGLPAARPYAVAVECAFAAAIPDAEWRGLAERSLGWNFGSRHVGSGFMTYPAAKRPPEALLQAAWEIMAFDCFVANPDRRETNPNVLWNGKHFALFDHEMAFFTEGQIGWAEPWQPGSIPLNRAAPPEHRHVFLAALADTAPDLTRLAKALKSIDDERLAAYREAMPEPWIGNGAAVDGILRYIRELREHIDEAVDVFTRSAAMM